VSGTVVSALRRHITRGAILFECFFLCLHIFMCDSKLSYLNKLFSIKNWILFLNSLYIEEILHLYKANSSA